MKKPIGLTVLPRTDHEGPQGEYRYSFTLPSTSALDGGGLSTPRPGRFTPGKDPVPCVQEPGWATRPVRTRAENLAPTWIRSPDHPARSESLYRLSYPGPNWSYSRFINSQQENSVHLYKNTNEKLLNTNVAVWFKHSADQTT